MASPNSTFTELVTTTFRKHRKGIKDNLSNANSLVKYLMKRGNYVLEDGGLEIVTPLDYAANGTYQRFSGWDVLNVQQSDVLTATNSPWRNIALHVGASGTEIRVNSGANRIESLVEARITNAMRTFNNNFSSDLYSSGSASNQITGLQAWVADTNTNTVGGIDANTWSFWQNNVTDASALSVTTSATTIENSLMLPAWLATWRGSDDHPDLILMDTTYYQYFEASQVSLKRYATSDSVSGGMVALKYKDADVLFDGGSGIPSSHAYFLNTQYLKLVVHRDADLEVIDDIQSFNQDGSLTRVLWMGNFVCSNRKMQSVIHE